MSNIRVTVTFEAVSGSGEATASESHGALVLQTTETERLAALVGNTVREAFPQFVGRNK